MKKNIILTILVCIIFSDMAHCQSGESEIVLDNSLSGLYNYEYVARDKVICMPGFSYTPATAKMLTLSVDPNLLINAEYNGSADYVDPVSRTIDKSLPVGNTPAVFNVDQMGAANYAIPIQVAPGTAGMEPKIAITYNSQSGNGICGFGWSFAAVSSITRAGKSMYYDGTVNSNSNDRFILDGQRLIFESGYQYGYNNSTYKKEVDDFSRIQAFGYTNTARPDYFIVTDKGGTKYYYGRVQNTSSQAYLKSGISDEIIAWYLYKVIDLHGNYMIYNYERDNTNGETWLTSIEYTGNANASLTPYNKVEFNYETRTDKSFSYINGQIITNSRILKHIRTYAEGELIRKYEMQYYFDTYTKLNEIYEFNANGERYNSIAVGYGTGSNLITKRSMLLNTTTVNQLGNYTFADFNGDGMMDFIRIYFAYDYGTNKYYYYYQLHYFSYVGSNNSCYTMVENDKFSSDNPVSVFPGDFDGDGKADILFRQGDAMQVWQSNGNGFNKGLYSFNLSAEEAIELQISDFDGDGKAEFCTSSRLFKLNSALSGASTYSLSLPYPYSFKSASAIDINADGKAEMVYHLNTNEIDAYTVSTTGSTQLTINNVPASKNRYYGNFNNDSYPDILQWNNSTSGWELLLNKNGTSFVSGTAPPLPNIDMEYEQTNNTIRLVDVSGDGLSDIVYASKSGTSAALIRVYSFNGDTWGTNEQTISDITPETYNYLYYFDVNGDGYQDLLYRKYSDPEYTVLDFYEGSGEKLVEKISNGQGSLISINYSRLNSGTTIYSKTSDATFPLLDFMGPINVVGSYTEKDISGMVLSDMGYHYAGLKLHLQGKGFMGFSQIETSDNKRNSSKTDVYRINQVKYYPYLLSSTTKVNGITISESTNMVSCIFTTGKAFWPQITNQSTKDYLQAVISAKSYSNYDDFGNPGLVYVYAYDTKGGTDDIQSIQTITTSYTTLSGTNYPNVPASVSVDNYLYSTKTHHIRNIDYTYSGANLDYKITDDGTPVELKEDFTYDACGNITQKSVYDGSNTLMRRESYGFDSKKRFVTSQTNGLGHSVTYTYEPKYGNILSKTNAAGIISSYTYDIWGNNLSETTPDGTTHVQLAWYSGTEFSGIQYYKRSYASDGSEAYEYFDCHGRKVYTKGRGFNGEWVNSESHYDEFGRVIQEVQSYKSGETPKIINYTYDEFDRVTLVEDNTKGENLFSIDYSEARKVQITDLLGNQGTTWKLYNALGQLVGAHDNGGDITYEYDAAGNLTTTNSPGGSTSMTYDLAGNQLSITDADAGTYTYTYDAVGQVLTKHHSVHGTTTYTYDIIGRMEQETGNTGTKTYQYISSGNGIGQLQSVSSSYGMDVTYEYAYNDLGRPVEKKETIGSDDYTFQYEYDQYGRLDRTVYPDGFATRNIYNSYGYLKGINKDNGALIWEAKELNGQGQPKSVEYGNGLVTEYGYDADYRTDLIKTYVKSNTAIVRQHLTFSWDQNTGNLAYRTDQLKGRRENFTYDNLDRLTKYQVVGQSDYNIAYNNSLDGAIASKTGIGSYTYNEGSSVHAHSSITANDGETGWATEYSDISYTGFNKVEQITEGANTVDFYYGPDFKRKKIDNFKDNKSKIYVGDLYEIEDPTGSPRELHYIPGLDGEAAIYTTESGSNGQMYYIHKDFLGSYQTITDQNGNIATFNGEEQVYSFDPWGRRRNATTWAYGAVPGDFLFARGFTGHEHIDALALINMNGRMYDPLTSTFLSPDPYVQSPDYTQNYNRYAYAMGNPFRYTDPSGFYVQAFPGRPSREDESSGGGSTQNNFGRKQGMGFSESSGGSRYTYAGNGRYVDLTTGQYVDFQTALNGNLRNLGGELVAPSPGQAQTIMTMCGSGDFALIVFDGPNGGGIYIYNFADGKTNKIGYNDNGNYTFNANFTPSPGISELVGFYNVAANGGGWSPYDLPSGARLAMAASAPAFGPAGTFMHFPDAVSIQGTLDLVPAIGGDVSLGNGKLFLLNGNGPTNAKYTDWGLSIGLDLGASFEVTEYYYLGPGQLNLQMFEGRRWEATGGFSFYGVEVGAGAVYAPVRLDGQLTGVIIGISYHIGVSPPGPSGHVNYYGETDVY